MSSGNQEPDVYDNEALLKLLKEKAKEIKVLTTKLTRLEERYVKFHRENKNLVQDHEVFENFIAHVFPNEFNNLKQVEYGHYDLNELKTLYDRRDQDQQNVISAMNSAHSDRITVLEHENKNMQDILQLRDRELEEFQLLKLENQRLAASTKTLQEDHDRQQREIEDARRDVARFRGFEEECAKLKAQSLLTALNTPQEDGDQRKKSDSEQLEESNTEIVNLKTSLGNQLKINGDLHEKIESLRAELAKSSESPQDPSSTSKSSAISKVDEDKSEREVQLEKQLAKLAADYQEQRSKAHKLLLEKDNQIEQLHESLKENNILEGLMGGPNASERKSSTSSQEHKLSLNGRKVDLQYLRNIVIKYMEYIAGGQTKEANTLSNVIYTILDFTPDEVNFIENTKSTNSWWGYASYFLTGKKVPKRYPFKSRDDLDMPGMGNNDIGEPHLERSNSVEDLKEQQLAFQQLWKPLSWNSCSQLRSTYYYPDHEDRAQSRVRLFQTSYAYAQPRVSFVSPSPSSPP